ncbi:MAG TPA: hypothetical protein VF797_13665 [Noviherbaspirillum sp.]
MMLRGFIPQRFQRQRRVALPLAAQQGHHFAKSPDATLSVIGCARHDVGQNGQEKLPVRSLRQHETGKRSVGIEGDVCARSFIARRGRPQSQPFGQRLQMRAGCNNDHAFASLDTRSDEVRELLNQELLIVIKLYKVFAM